MKRKILKSIAHNFSHSFMSYINYSGVSIDAIREFGPTFFRSQ